jgi:hypothetical protein
MLLVEKKKVKKVKKEEEEMGTCAGQPSDIPVSCGDISVIPLPIEDSAVTWGT